jgi:predicted permease
MSDHLTVEGGEDAGGSHRPLAELQLVSPGYFATLALPVRRGRGFTDDDREGAPPVAVINETLARQFFPNRDPIGRWVRTGGDGNPRLRVVGVVPDVRHQGLDAAPAPTVYTPHRQNPWWRPMHLVVRTAGDPLAAAPALRRAVAAVDPGVPLDDVRSLEQLVYASAARPRLRAGLLGAFGGLALALAVAGIYGVMAYAVRQRRREMGVRLALGAPRGAVVRLVVGDGMRLAGAGVALGLVLAVALTRLLASVLFEVSPVDPATFALTTLVLAAAGLAACAVPAWRASRTDAMIALRSD